MSDNFQQNGLDLLDNENILTNFMAFLVLKRFGILLL